MSTEQETTTENNNETEIQCTLHTDSVRMASKKVCSVTGQKTSKGLHHETG